MSTVKESQKFTPADWQKFEELLPRFENLIKSYAARFAKAHYALGYDDMVQNLLWEVVHVIHQYHGKTDKELVKLIKTGLPMVKNTEYSYYLKSGKRSGIEIDIDDTSIAALDVNVEELWFREVVGHVRLIVSNLAANVLMLKLLPDDQLTKIVQDEIQQQVDQVAKGERKKLAFEVIPKPRHIQKRLGITAQQMKEAEEDLAKIGIRNLHVLLAGAPRAVPVRYLKDDENE